MRQIYCPECARNLYKYDGKHSSEIIKKCKCGKYIKFVPTTNRTVIVNKPERETSSGARFW